MESSRTDRTCRFEQMEPRQLLAADVSLAAISLEPTLGSVAGEVPVSIGTTPGSIAGQVAFSTDNSGLEGVVLRLLGETGNLLNQTQTDAAGNYGFADLSPGVYAVLEIQPPGIHDDRALVGSGGGVAFDNNLLGEIIVYSGSSLVGYNFFEHLADELSESGTEEPPPLVKHFGKGLQGQETLIADAALWLMYGSPSVSVPQLGLPFESSALLTSPVADLPSLPAVLASSVPYSGSFARADSQPIGGGRESSEPSDVFQDSLWQLDIDFESDDWFSAADRADRLADPGDVPLASNWSSDQGEQGVFRKISWLLDHQDNQGLLELEAEDYDRVFELGETDDHLRLEEKSLRR